MAQTLEDISIKGQTLGMFLSVDISGRQATPTYPYRHGNYKTVSLLLPCITGIIRPLIISVNARGWGCGSLEELFNQICDS
ncbi:hypothetical protein PAXRUDRAFT_830998 [Paxillus rubicundulus Ve08.2h10]|uniref:Uncharacterized protein n=1 Tax=Paxillus rubicundulus Ve08.2h10 TaxID=930991 RepID=A0A0D0DSP6_9AGAM|nr:hypothetical protein PAXRUDRAFT_830998 [Paxillus rubicundulus Ve08.2h10]